jgi:tRNA(Ile)-lysidine synthase
MPALDPAVAATRNAVGAALDALQPDALVLVACSGGADSLALAAAAAFVAPRRGLRAGLVTVDHGLQSGSDIRAADLVKWASAAGFDPALAVAVEVTERGDGSESAARDARYAALATTAESTGAAAVLVGHTRDDQAETVLLALARGAGPRGIAAMPPRRLVRGMTLLRPFLGISRDQTRAACAVQTLPVWDDPHNQEPKFARVRVRQAMSTLVEALGPGIVANLARTASLIGADDDALTAIADAARIDLASPSGGLDCTALLALPPAVRTRVLRDFALDLGAAGSALSSAHIGALDALVTSWHGQGPVYLPGGITVARRNGLLARS